MEKLDHLYTILNNQMLYIYASLSCNKIITILFGVIMMMVLVNYCDEREIPMVLQILLVLLFLVVIASVIMVRFCVYVVWQQSVAIIERW